MLEFGVGSISWDGDPWLSAIGVGIISLIGVTYALEVAHDKPTTIDEEKELLMSCPDEIETPHQAPTKDSIAEEKKRRYGKKTEKRPPVTNTVAVLSGLSVLVCSVSLVYTNAWVLSRFPYVCTYITVQQGACFIAAFFAVRVFRVVEPVELSWRTYIFRVAPLGLCFTLYLWGSNTAYTVLEPGLVQMLKPIGSCFVFAHACALGVEEYSRAKAANFVFITTGTLLTAAPEIMSGIGGIDGTTPGNVVFGVGVLVIAYFCDAYYVVCIQRLYEGDHLVSKPFDPLTTLMCISPIVTVFLLMGSLYGETEAWPKLLATLGLPTLVASCVLSFAFNIAVMNFIGRLSATSFVIFEYLKDLIILSVAFFLFAEHFARNELIGYLVVLVGAATWRHRKLRAAQHRDLLPEEDLVESVDNGEATLPVVDDSAEVVPAECSGVTICSPTGTRRRVSESPRIVQETPRFFAERPTSPQAGGVELPVTSPKLLGEQHRS